MIEIFLAFTAFILAFFQLVKSNTLFRLNLGFVSRSMLFYCFTTIGILSLFKEFFSYYPSILSSTIDIYNLAANTVNYSLKENFATINYSTIQFIGHLVFFLCYAGMTGIVIYLFYMFITPSKFKVTNSKRYLDQCNLIIASGIEKDMNALILEVTDSIPSIFTLASNKECPLENAYQILELFSDASFCRQLVNHHPEALYCTFKTINTHIDYYDQPPIPLGKSLINRLIAYSFTEKNSILNREEPYRGLGKFQTIKNTMFGKKQFLTSCYFPLSHPLSLEREELTEHAIKKYCEILIFALEVYLKGERGDNRPSIFFSSLNELAEISKSNIYVVKKLGDQETDTAPAYKNLIAISVGIGSLINFIKANDSLFYKEELTISNAENYSFFENDNNIYGAIAQGLYAIFEAFSMTPHLFESIRLLTLDLYPNFPEKNNIVLEAITNRLDILLLNKIKQNLSELLYPAVTASLIYSFGLCEPDKARIALHKKLLLEVKSKFIAAYQKNSDIALDMLSPDTVYLPDEKKLERRHAFRYKRFKTTEELVLINNELLTINTDLVRGLINNQFPQWKDLPVQPVEFSGWDNRTFHLGEQMLVRMPSAIKYIEQVEKEHKWLPVLAPLLPLQIPTPIAMGKPESAYPWKWSIYNWLEGNTASNVSITDLSSFATNLAKFLIALHRIDTTGGPPPGSHNFYRGGTLTQYDSETRKAIILLKDKINVSKATEIWETAIATKWSNPPVWVHGDISASNLLVKSGQLCAVIDFGMLAVGDPACDLAIAWTFLTEKNRGVFRKALSLDDATWIRGRAWALWKALIVAAGLTDTNTAEASQAWHTLDEILKDS